MEGDDYSLDTNFGSFSDAMELDLMEDLFLDGCWLEATDGNSFQFETSSIPAVPDSKTNHFGANPKQKLHVDETHFTKLEPLDSSTTLGQSQILVDVEGTDLGTSLWIGPKSSSGPSTSSVKERLFQALEFIQELMKDRDILIQIWVPVKRGDKSFLTTKKQPHSCKQNCSSLKKYRHVSEGYNFPADEGSEESVGLPGRVFLAKLPEWTPDVRYFKCDEYPRIKFAQEYDVRGSLALPVFERGNGNCQGVVEIVTTTQQINYRPELENICKALEAVDLQSSNNPSPRFKEIPQLQNEPYQTELPEISKVLESVCRANRLPLALTWAPCIRQGKTGSRHSEQNYTLCVSTIDSACFVPDEDSQSFLEACSEHHLLQGEGIVGRAFETNRQCFITDITAFSKTNYPLAHHAKVFGLHAGLAIPLRGIYTGLVELVLELFLPKDCIETECQRQMLNSLTAAMQENFKSAYLIMDKQLEEEVILPVRETIVFSDGIKENQETRSSSYLKEILSDESSWIAHMMEANRKGKGVSLSWEYQTEELKDEFKLINSSGNCQIDTELVEFQKDSAPKSNKITVSGSRESLGCRKPGEKRRTKTEKTISLEVIRQYFAGSLKDAAKSLGVCPTTLKRICRQHGIARWPSRKIKKVDHSLKKLQLVIDSVQGIDGSIQLGSFYTNFPDLGSPNFSGAESFSKIPEQSEQLQEASKTPSSSCDQSSWSKTGKKSNMENALSCRNSVAAENPIELLKKARSAAELHAMNQDETKVLARTQSHRTLGENLHYESIPPGPPLQQKQVRNLKCRNTVEVKAVFGEGKVRFNLQQNWGIRDLREKIAKCFNIDDISTFDLKYLDDDREWVLLTCDADLDECVDIYRSSRSRRIKIAVQQASQTKLGSSFGSRGKS